MHHPINKSLSEFLHVILSFQTKADTCNISPALLPIGASLGNYLRAFYLIGEFDKMLPFLITPDCIDHEEVIYKLRRMNWGYDIDMTNIQWNEDSSFLATYNTSINNTSGIEQYIGAIENDTAKLYTLRNASELIIF